MRATRTIKTRCAERRRPCRPTGGLTGGLAAIAIGLPVAAGSAQDFAGSGVAPSDATACLRIDRRHAPDAWLELALEGVGIWQAPVRDAWRAADVVVDRLAPDAAASIHAVGPGGRRWLHAVRWQDPIRLQDGLQQLGSRPMGGGRFQLPMQGLDLTVLDGWVLFGPRDSPWLDDAADRLRLEVFDAAGPAFRQLSRSMESAPVEIALKHPDPIRGITAIGIHPRDATAARLEIAGTYAASPLPIRTAGSIEAGVIGGFEGRVALAVVESGIGLLDPLLVRSSLEHPELVPSPDLRRRFASRRVLVWDGASTSIDPLGIIEVPAACIAVPVREADDPAVDTLDDEVDAWLATAGRAVRGEWTPEEVEVTRTRGDEIRHLSLEPGLLKATGGHPMALTASLNWTVHRSARGGAWLVAGTTPGLVRKVTGSLDDATARMSSKPLAMAGVASPARIALQLEELAQLRGLGADVGADADARALAAAATILDRIERVTWRSTRQDEHEIRATAEIRLVLGRTPHVDDHPDADDR